MDLSDQNLETVTIVLALAVGLLLALNWIFRKRGGVTTGWTGAWFIGLCFVAALIVIVVRTTH